jgi:actin-related protein 8
VQALRIPDPAASGYELRWPFLRGNFNTQGYTTPQELLGDVETIYTTAIQEELGIEPEDLKVSSAVIVSVCVSCVRGLDVLEST